MKESPSVLRWALAFLQPYRARVVVLGALLVAEVGLGVLQPWTLKVLIDNALLNQPFGWDAAERLRLALAGNSRVSLLIVVVVTGALLQLLNQVVSVFSTQLQVETGQRMVYGLRYRLFEHLQALRLHHHVTTPTGDSVYRVDVDAYAIENLLIGGFPLVTSCATLVVMFTILLTFDVTVALLSLAIVPFLFLAIRYYIRTLMTQEEGVKELESKLVQRLHETFSAMRLVKSFARERHEVDRYASAGDRTMAARIELTWQQSVFSAVVTAITILGTALVLVVGGVQFMRGELSIGELTVVPAYMASVYGPLSAIAYTTGQLQGALAGAKRIRAMLAMVPETADHSGAVDATDVRGEIRFENVGFAYPNGAPVVDQISFQAAPGQMIALVGLTGAGKTTLVSLIPRFYEATSGRVLIDGVDVRQYRVRSLREHIAIVLQEPLLFSGTVADNVRYGRLDATQTEIEDAARAAGAHDFVSRMPNGYQTAIAEAGASLSGGERQRLSVARAILKNAPILILDEPTSSLDAISEEVVFSALKRLRAGRTTIVIAHRLSTVRDADQILVLDGGRISAMGRHDELLKTSLLYRRMCARLSVGKSLDEPESVDELIQAARR